MKKITAAFLMLFTCILFFSCNTEEEIITEETQKFQEEIFSKNIENASVNTPTALEGVYFLNEGRKNPIYVLQNFSEDQEIIDIYTSEIEVQIEMDEEDNYLILIDDYTEFITTVTQSIDAHLPERGYFTLYDLSLRVMNRSQAIVSLKSVAINPLQIPPATPAQIFPVPLGGTVYGAELNGWCGLSNPGIDAAVFIDGVIQPLAASNISTCPNMPNRYIFTMGYMRTSNIYDVTLAHGLTWNYALNAVWKDTTNSCIGHSTNFSTNNAIWQNLYNNARGLVQAGIPTYQQWGNAVFAYGSFQSKTFQNSGNQLDGQYDYYHEGLFFYGLEICI